MKEIVKKSTHTEVAENWFAEHYPDRDYYKSIKDFGNDGVLLTVMVEINQYRDEEVEQIRFRNGQIYKKKSKGITVLGTYLTQ